MNDLVVIESKKAWVRILLVAAVAVTIFVAWIAIKWQLGSMIANLTEPSHPNVDELADLAVSWAPGDPAANWLDALTGEDVAIFEKTVRLAPFEYRWRVEFGRVLEQDGQLEQAESEFRKATDLAPAYAYPRWNLGNFYLRQNRVEEALTELRLAAEKNQPYREQVFALAWDYFDKDTARIENLAGDGSEARARVAYFFAGRGRAEDSLRNWNRLSDEEKEKYPEIAKTIAHGFFNQGRFPQSLEFARQLGTDADARPEAVTNGSFEKGIGDAPDSRFGWTVIRNDPKLEIASDAKVKRDGNRSVRLTFKNYIRPELYNLSQTVVVQPGARYRLRTWFRTENLRSGGLPLMEIMNANDNRLIARSQTFPAGTSDWQEMAVEFSAPENCSGITIRTARSPCGEECPISGILWYDDFEIERR